MRKFLLITTLSLLVFTSYSQEEETTVEGIVTYFHNETIGNRADTGSIVYFRPAKYTDTINNSFYKLRYFEVYLNSSALTAKYIKPSDKKLEEIKRNTDSLNFYDELTDKAIKNISSETFKTSVDGTGRYKIKLPNGLYEIIVISSNRKGRKLNRFVEIIDNKPVDVDFEFGRL
ncbi:hypothetical protein [Gaetbulibacter sp. PBL-D1]|uniref:hypothetical protein n=1 Tax=Gaetbulibacter sp. PBL-D1 TaxID=3422594 RepID=UPI003D2F1BEE